MSRNWQQQRERGTVLALRLIHWIGIRIGRWAGRLLLHPITLYFLLTAGSQRRGSRLYLRRVLEHEPHWIDIYRHIHCFSCTILDRAFLLSGQYHRFDVQVHDHAQLLEQAHAGQGALLLGSHLGSFEILRVLGEVNTLPVKILMNLDHNSSITQYFAAINPQLAAAVIPIGRPDTLLKVKASLEQGDLIGALGDRVINDDKTVRCHFLGQATNFPSGPLLLAAAMHCPVILFFGLYRGGRCYDIYFERLSDEIILRRGQREADLQIWAQRYVDRLTHYAYNAPYNWFNFYDFWPPDNRKRAL